LGIVKKNVAPFPSSLSSQIFPYISDCDIDAIEALYDGGNTSEVVCES